MKISDMSTCIKEYRYEYVRKSKMIHIKRKIEMHRS
jgi:hypothetical protein